MDAELQPLLQCPRCRGQLAFRAQTSECRSCQTEFPELGGIPCLMPEPSRSVADWRRESQRLNELLERSVDTMEEQLKRPDLLPRTRERVKLLQKGHRDNGERVAALLREAGLAPDSRAKASDKAFALMEYYDQILRDWAWDREGQTENQLSFDRLVDSLGGDHKLGKVLVLGAGPCRLAYDLHQRLAPALTVALDINPVLLLVGRKAMFEGGLKLYEFPPDPRGWDSYSVEHELRAEGGPPAHFFPVLADAFSPPFRPGQFDTVVTPWFIDIVPVDVRETLAVIHGLLAPGGRWVNYGPLSYQVDRPHNLRYSHEELYELMPLAGFQLVGEPAVTRIDFMQSRAAARGKVVDVINFSARRTDPGTAPAPGGQPPALADAAPPAHPPVRRAGRVQAGPPDAGLPGGDHRWAANAAGPGPENDRRARRQARRGADRRPRHVRADPRRGEEVGASGARGVIPGVVVRQHGGRARKTPDNKENDHDHADRPDPDRRFAFRPTAARPGQPSGRNRVRMRVRRRLRLPARLLLDPTRACPK